MTQREEISIRLGVDSRAAITGIERIQNQITKFSNDAMKKLGSIFKANVFHAATDLATQLIPSWEQIWDSIYGTSPELMKKSEEANANIRNLMANLTKAEKELKSLREKTAFDNAPSSEKLRMLKDQKAGADAEVYRTQKRYDLNESEIKALGNQTSMGAHNRRMELLNQQITNLTKVNEAKIAQETLAEQIRKLTTSMSPNTMEEELKKMIAATLEWVKPLRENIKRNQTLENAFGAAGQFDLAIDARSRKQNSLSALGDIVASRRLLQMGDVANAIPNLDMLGMNQFKDSIVEAQKAAISAVIQKVQIVDVDLK